MAAAGRLAGQSLGAPHRDHHVGAVVVVGRVSEGSSTAGLDTYKTRTYILVSPQNAAAASPADAANYCRSAYFCLLLSVFQRENTEISTGQSLFSSRAGAVSSEVAAERSIRSERRMAAA